MKQSSLSSVSVIASSSPDPPLESVAASLRFPPEPGLKLFLFPGDGGERRERPGWKTGREKSDGPTDATDRFPSLSALTVLGGRPVIRWCSLS